MRRFRTTTLRSANIADRPNIVWVTADDLGSPLSLHGTVGVKAPHIDQLASEGMFFSRYYATAASCAPSRTAILTGGRFSNRVSG